MADVNISPNMNLPIPTTEDTGPDYVTNNTACLNAIDSHNHVPGQGVQITPDGMDISSDLSIKGNNLTVVKSVNFSAQGSPLAGGADIGCVYVSGKDLYYNDEDGNQVRITQGGNVVGSTGTITGLPSGTASASYSAATFTFQSATATPANMAVGPLIVGANIASSKTVTMSPNTSQSGNYAINFPLALPASTSILNCDASGQQAYVAPDNSTFGINGGVYKVLNGGINTAQLASGAVTNVKISDDSVSTAKIQDLSVTSAKLAATNYFTASATSVVITSTSFTAVTGLTGPLTCLGTRPCIVTLCSPSNTSVSGISLSSGIQLQLRFLRGATIIGITVIQFSGIVANISPSWTVFDVPNAGSNSYLLQAKVSSGSATFDNCALTVLEL